MAARASTRIGPSRTTAHALEDCPEPDLRIGGDQSVALCSARAGLAILSRYFSICCADSAI
jgi:hypothetical protein